MDWHGTDKIGRCSFCADVCKTLATFIDSGLVLVWAYSDISRNNSLKEFLEMLIPDNPGAADEIWDAWRIPKCMGSGHWWSSLLLWICKNYHRTPAASCTAIEASEGGDPRILALGCANLWPGIWWPGVWCPRRWPYLRHHQIVGLSIYYLASFASWYLGPPRMQMVGGGQSNLLIQLITTIARHGWNNVGN
jgi:hypothetical protein